jgi:hypothetical protein
MANLATWSYFPDEKLEEEMAPAILNGFLKNTTLAEQQWVRQTVARLRSERHLLYQNKSKGFSGGFNGARQPYYPNQVPNYPNNSRSSSPYGYRSIDNRPAGEAYGTVEKPAAL